MLCKTLSAYDPRGECHVGLCQGSREELEDCVEDIMERWAPTGPYTSPIERVNKNPVYGVLCFHV